MKSAIAAVLLCATTVAHADMGLQTVETFIHAQAVESLGLSVLSSPGTATTLRYSFAVNTNDGSFT